MGSTIFTERNTVIPSEALSFRAQHCHSERSEESNRLAQELVY